MAFVGGGLYDIETCPDCRELMYNGCCENKECNYHWNPKDEEESVDEE